MCAQEDDGTNADRDDEWNTSKTAVRPDDQLELTEQVCWDTLLDRLCSANNSLNSLGSFSIVINVAATQTTTAITAGTEGGIHSSADC